MQQMYRFSAEESAELKRLAAEDPKSCCIDNTPEMCRLLLRFGANPNARDTERWTPLHAAATCHHTELCAILIAHGADLLAMNADGNMPYECCLPGPTLSLIETEMDKRGITQEELDDLHRLPECEMLADMETLYKSGADMNTLDKQGAALLHIAAACGYEEVTIFLLKHGAKIDQLDRDGWQAIHIAACWEHLEIIEILVNFGADIMAETTSGETVFDICDDLEMHARLVEIKEEAERKQFQQQDALNRPEKPKDASIRRTSMREKKMISWKEAKQEAEMRGVGSLDLADGDTELAPPEPVNPTEMNAERRVTSPLTVNTNITMAQQQQPSVRTSTSAVSPTVPPASTRHSSTSHSPSVTSPNVQPLETVQSPRSKRPSTVSSNGVFSPTGSDSSVFSNGNRKTSDRSSTKPPRSEKRVTSPEPGSHIGSKRGTMENEHKPTRRVTPSNPNNEGQYTPSQPVRTLSKPTGSGIDQTLHQMPPSPATKTRNHVNDRCSNQPGGALRNTTQTASSPTLAHRASTQSRRARISDSTEPGKTDPTTPNLSAHNAYFNPVHHSQPLSPNSGGHGGTVHSTQIRQTRPSYGSQSTEHDTVQTTNLPRKSVRELIEYDSDSKISGKCCVVM
ncbi:unnamed protein product [Echinostoma caproni]|uniref:ANK_REP_REGION domain-containing protein n=1 Tax=Echinostoma caproni TaxID=27848 RepID=A0A183A6R4_9TREM|nr:unnamed protein product [Echinostoma caproni]